MLPQSTGKQIQKDPMELRAASAVTKVSKKGSAIGIADLLKTCFNSHEIGDTHFLVLFFQISWRLALNLLYS